MQLLFLLRLLVAPYALLTLAGRRLGALRFDAAARARVGLSLFFAFTALGHSPFLIEVDRPWHEQTPQQLPPLPQAGEHFRAWSWSADGGKLAGARINRTDSKSSICVYDFERRSYEQLAAFGDRPVWLRDGRRLLFHAGGASIPSTPRRGASARSSPPRPTSPNPPSSRGTNGPSTSHSSAPKPTSGSSASGSGPARAAASVAGIRLTPSERVHHPRAT